MAATHPWKVYRCDNEYIASVKHPEHAAMLLAGLGEHGATIRWGHPRRNIAWADGVNGDAWESYDYVAEVCIGWQEALQSRQDQMARDLNLGLAYHAQGGK